eukprot:m.1143764 g.1143764  ORF g.1143764 m.1143764 type:complete len:223 (+) comp24459_c0_seq19:1300-1968(+)
MSTLGNTRPGLHAAGPHTDVRHKHFRSRDHTLHFSWDAEWTLLSSAIRTNTSIASLSLAGNRFGSNPSGMQRLCAAVADNCVLRTLDLSCNDIDGVDATCTEYLASALVSNSSIRALLLDLNYIGDQGARNLASVFTHSSRFSVVDVQFNAVGPQARAAIEGTSWCRAPSTEELCQSRVLRLVHNRITDDGVLAMHSAASIHSQGVQFLHEHQRSGLAHAAM